PQGALLVATHDRSAAGMALDKAARSSASLDGARALHGSYSGVGYTEFDRATAGIVGDFVVVTRSTDIFEEVVRASEGSSLGDDDDFTTTMDRLPKDRVATFYLRSSQLASLTPIPIGVLPVFSAAPSVGVAAFLRSDAIVFEEAVDRGTGATALGTAFRAIATGFVPPAIGRLVDGLLDGQGLGDQPAVDEATLDEVRAGLGSGYAVEGVLDRHSLVTVAGEVKSLPDAARTFLDHLSYVAVGARSDHETLLARIVIGVQ
ncbi:MAG: hypothetical protein M3290_13880, partial [Actinomycetota bacterium]|nr:hypothetical protein [Actinomycetota bacterium]